MEYLEPPLESRLLLEDACLAGWGCSCDPRDLELAVANPYSQFSADSVKTQLHCGREGRLPRIIALPQISLRLCKRDSAPCIQSQGSYSRVSLLLRRSLAVTQLVALVQHSRSITSHKSTATARSAPESCCDLAHCCVHSQIHCCALPSHHHESGNSPQYH